MFNEDKLVVLALASLVVLLLLLLIFLFFFPFPVPPLVVVVVVVVVSYPCPYGLKAAPFPPLPGKNDDELLFPFLAKMDLKVDALLLKLVSTGRERDKFDDEAPVPPLVVYG